MIGRNHRSVSSVTVNRPHFIVGVAAGLDNTRLLPPFPPGLRGEDVIFGELLFSSDRSACAAWLPDAVFHEPFSHRRRRIASIFRSPGPTTAQLLRTFISGRAVGGADVAETLIDIGKALTDLASQNPSSFRKMWRSMWAEWCDREVLRCESAQDSFDRHPHFWSRDMKAYSEGVLGLRDKEALPYDEKACGGSWVSRARSRG